jgi:hypothetical protein
MRAISVQEKALKYEEMTESLPVPLGNTRSYRTGSQELNFECDGVSALFTAFWQLVRVTF